MNLKPGLKTIGVLALASLMLIIVLALGGCGSSDGGLQNDSLAPNFKLQNLDNQSIALKDLRGKAVLINFWDTTCPPCVNEMPYFQSLFEAWSTRSDVALLTINIGETESTVQNFMQTNNYTFPVLLDSQVKVANQYGVRYTPTSCFIDKDGILKASIIGAFKDKTAIEKKAIEVGFTLN